MTIAIIARRTLVLVAGLGLTAMLGACSSFNQCMNPEVMTPVPGNVNATQGVN